MIDRFEELIDPCYPISSEASRVSGITQSMVLGKQKINETLRVFLEFIKNAVLIAHNAKFDCAFLASELDRASLPYFTNIVLDTKLIAKRVWKNLPGYGLERLLAELSLPHGRLHRALNDAEACRDIFLISLKKIQETADLTFSLLGGTAFIMEANHT
jgi:DNA polymerase-3 subunit alpha (Gram-positive type)